MKKIIVFLSILIIFFSTSSKVSASVNTASSYVLMDMDSNRVLLSKNKDKRMLIASITKIMTAIIAIESNKLDDIVKVDDSILKSYGSGIYIQVGEEISLKDLVYGLMLRSGNDAALMISSYVSGNEEEFVKKMNEKAKKLKMYNTTFVNSSGLDNTDSGNYSTAYDMGILMSYAMKNEDFKSITGTKKHIVKTNYKTYSWTNKNKILGINNINGGKTGYTEKAKRTLVTTSSIDNKNFVVVTLSDSDDWNTHKNLHTYADDNYISYKLLDKDKYNIFDRVVNGNLYINNDRYVTLKKDIELDLVNHIKIDKKKYYKNNEKVGTNNIYINDELLITEPIYLNKKKTKDTIFSRLRDFIYA